MEPLKKIDLSQIVIRELEREQAWIDRVENNRTALDPEPVTKYQKWVHWWNGKKTWAGLGLIGIAVTFIVLKIPGVTITGALGIVTTVYGAIHKLFKSDNFGGKGKIVLDNDSFILLIKETIEIIKRWINLIKGVKK
jgi:hypothetical protein